LLRIQNLILLAMVNLDLNYKDELRKSRIKEAQNYVNAHIFTADFTRSCLQLLVSKYMRLSEEDLQFWNDEPEQFVQEEEADHWEYNVRVTSKS
jgi:hypothetical protein